MIDQSSIRLQMVKRIIEAMDSEFASDEDGSLWIDDGRWQIFLPDQPTSDVLIRFSKNLYPAVAADIATRFSGVANLMGLDVSRRGCYDPNDDATGVMLIQED